jgi:hypothetical protein
MLRNRKYDKSRFTSLTFEFKNIRDWREFKILGSNVPIFHSKPLLTIANDQRTSIGTYFSPVLSFDPLILNLKISQLAANTKFSSNQFSNIAV